MQDTDHYMTAKIWNVSIPIRNVSMNCWRGASESQQKVQFTCNLVGCLNSSSWETICKGCYKQKTSRLTVEQFWIYNIHMKAMQALWMPPRFGKTAVLQRRTFYLTNANLPPIYNLYDSSAAAETAHRFSCFQKLKLAAKLSSRARASHTTQRWSDWLLKEALNTQDACKFVQQLQMPYVVPGWSKLMMDCQTGRSLTKPSSYWVSKNALDTCVACEFHHSSTKAADWCYSNKLRSGYQIAYKYSQSRPSESQSKLFNRPEIQIHHLECVMKSKVTDMQQEMDNRRHDCYSHLRLSNGSIRPTRQWQIVVRITQHGFWLFWGQIYFSIGKFSLKFRSNSTAFWSFLRLAALLYCVRMRRRVFCYIRKASHTWFTAV